MLAGLYVLGGVLLSTDYPSIMAYTASVFRKNTGSALAIAGAASAGASLLVPPLVGYVSEVTGSLAKAMMVPPAFLSILSLLAYVRKVWKPRSEVIA
jgi:MFS family permease